MKNRSKNAIKMGSHLGIDFGAIWEDFGGQVGTKNRIRGRLRAAQEAQELRKAPKGPRTERHRASRELRKASVSRVISPSP